MKRALFFGLNYKGTAYELPDCYKDADDLHTVFAQNHSDISWQLHGVASVESFLAAITSFARKQRASDTLVITFSGHGTQVPRYDPSSDPNEGAWDEGLVFYSGDRGFEVLLDDELRGFLFDIPGTVILVFDSCFSGGMTREAHAFPGFAHWKKKFVHFDPDAMTVNHINRTATNLKRLLDVPQRFYRLYACGEEEFAISTGTNGLFTQGILTGIAAGQKTVGNIFRTASAHCVDDQHPVLQIQRGNPSKLLFK